MTAPQAPVIFFDGVCNLCNQSVNYIIKHDEHKIFRFASLQSEIAKHLLSERPELIQNMGSVVLLESGTIYTHSTAAFRILKQLKSSWRWLLIFRYLPSRFTDFFYDLIANNRYRWFGKKDSCMMPTAELKSRFLD
ncbi:MAG: thiol-disulfide oxidoreductase DCC family protein [Chitinophagaceae bacterium]|nr:thiol-disulfide oxidoreductase DCC family protein [Chitinophagaceae bacterium]